jgi:SAM-dependent methyltransferase
MAAVSAGRPDYGVDAPGVIRNLLLVAFTGLLTWATARAGWWSGSIGNAHVTIHVAQSVLWPGSACAITAVWMLWHSKVGKVRGREALLDQLTWTGAERVLDIGCGRGLMLIGAARRVARGTATGIDIWQEEDLSGNHPDATRQNAIREGVADRVTVQTADMRALPFADGSFDVVLSSAAIHNLYEAHDRLKAINEIARVLKPGGQLLIDDIRHCSEYAKGLRQAHCTVRRTDARIISLLTTLWTFGSLRPGTLLATKSA